MATVTGLTKTKILSLINDIGANIGHIVDTDLVNIGLSLADLDIALTDNQLQLSNLNTVVLPALQIDLQEAKEALAANTAQIDILNGVTLPALTIELSTLNDVTIPALQADLAAANITLTANTGLIATLNGKFPIVGTDISDSAITTPKMSANSIDGDRILANSLNASKVVAGSITTDRMTANTINGSVITAETMNAAKLIAGTIGTDRMTANSINGDRMTANTINASKIVAGSITTDRMTANSISGDVITANTLYGDRIVANTINGDRVVANTVQGDRIIANTMSADRLIATTIQAAIVSANAINGITITGSRVRTAPSGMRTELSSTNNALEVYASTGALVGRLWSYNYLGTNLLGIFGSGSSSFLIGDTGNFNQGALTVGGDLAAADAYVYNVYFPAASIPTSTGGDPAYIGSGGRLMIHSVPSLEKFKRDIEYVDVNLDSLSEMRPVSYRYKTDVPFEVEDYDEINHSILINKAEELGGLDFLIGRDENGDAFQYLSKNLPLALLVGFNDHHPRLAEHDRQLDDYNKRLERIEQALFN